MIFYILLYLPPIRCQGFSISGFKNIISIAMFENLLQPLLVPKFFQIFQIAFLWFKMILSQIPDTFLVRPHHSASIAIMCLLRLFGHYAYLSIWTVRNLDFLLHVGQVFCIGQVIMGILWSKFVLNILHCLKFQSWTV